MKTANIIVTEPGLGREVNPFVNPNEKYSHEFKECDYENFAVMVKTIPALSKDNKPLPKGWTGECELVWQIYTRSKSGRMWLTIDDKMLSQPKLTIELILWDAERKKIKTREAYIALSPIKEESAKDAHCNETVDILARRAWEATNRNHPVNPNSFILGFKTGFKMQQPIIADYALREAPQSKDMVSRAEVVTTIGEYYNSYTHGRMLT